MRFFGRKYCTYICSTMYWPFGSSLVIGPPGWRWICAHLLAAYLGDAPADMERAHAAQHDVVVGERRQRNEPQRECEQCTHLSPPSLLLMIVADPGGGAPRWARGWAGS